MNAVCSPGFEWYGNPPDGIKRVLYHHDQSRRAVSWFLHRLPDRTGMMLDLSSDPVISLEINPNGTVERVVEGQRQNAALRSDTLTLTPAFAVCDWRWIGDPLDILDVYIPYELLREAWANHFRGDPANVNLRPDLVLHDESLLLLMKSLLALMKSGRNNMTMLYETLTEHLIFSLLSLENRAIAARSHRPGVLPPIVLRRVQHYIEEHLAENIRLEALASVAGVSRFHFLRQFRQTIGETPHAYLTQRRLARACDLLRSSDLSVTDIAARCGFEDPSHFAERFRRSHLVSPREYRRARR